MKMKLNKIEKELLSTLIILITGVIINAILISPVKAKIENLQIENEEIINSKKEKLVKEQKNDGSSNNQLVEDEIVLKIEKEFSKFIDVLYVNKFVEWDGNNNEYTKIELKVSGSIDQLFNINNEVEKIKGKNSIENIQINKKINNNVEIGEEIKVDTIDCVMTFRVG